MISKLKTIFKGFTLIETMVAVLLLSMAIAGPLTIASKGLTSAVIAKDQVGAFYLAQDAIEYLRFKRDTNKLGGSAWLTNLAACTSANGANICQIDSIQDTVSACSGTCGVLNYDSANHYYSYTTGTQSPERYIRTIKIITPVGSNNSEAQITVTVQWTSAGGLTHSVTYREDVFDWQ